MKLFRYVVAAALAVLMCLPAAAADSAQKRKKKKADENTMAWYYELETYAAPYKGSCDIKVWSYGRDIITARDQAMKNAVHGVIFRGIPANASKRLNSLPPIVDDIMAEQNNKAFFDAFFKNGGPYLRYATKTLPDGNDEILRYDRKNYKVGVAVTVQYDELRKALAQQGIIDSLTSGFAK